MVIGVLSLKNCTLRARKYKRVKLNPLGGAFFRKKGSLAKLDNIEFLLGKTRARAAQKDSHMESVFETLFGCFFNFGAELGVENGRGSTWENA